MYTNKNSSKIIVFISYAREDSDFAKKLYKDLKRKGLNPWMDKESILPGQDWEKKIRDGIKNSKYFIPLLSSTSIKKRGYIQKELKFALNVLKEIPDSDIFVIPARLDECEIPYEKLNKYQYVDLFGNWKEGIQRILLAMGLIDSTKIKSTPSIYSSKQEEWANFLESIVSKRCIPFIGPHALTNWNDIIIELIEKWISKYDYPLDNTKQLPLIAQFLILKEDDQFAPHNLISRRLQELKPPDYSIEKNKNTLYAVLADLNLPIYFTTNYDHYMESALISKGKKPKSDFLRWNKYLKEYTERIELWSFDKTKDYVPSEATPLVYHLYGDMDIAESMVLTEKDYLDFIIYLNNKENMIPDLIKRKLSSTSLLFIGYNIKDIYSRLTLQSLIDSFNIRYQSSNFAIMDEVNSSKQIQKSKNLEEYVKNIYKSKIYWDTIPSFSIKLRENWNEYRQKLTKDQ